MRIRKIGKKSKKAAIEMSVGTIVVIVLSVTMLILGLVLIRTIFTGAKYNIDTINDKVKDNINQLFSDETKAVVYLSNSVVKIKQGDSWGVAFAINNKGESQKFEWEILPNDERIEDKCGVTTEEALEWISTGEKGSVDIPSGQKHYSLARFNIPETGVSDISKCIARFQLVINTEDGEPYDTVDFDVDIE
ncbi:MAG: hypothetical protein AABX30_02925 [Nanoarchaeota archaeon]